MQARSVLAWLGWMLLGAALVLPVLAWQGRWFDAARWPIRHLRIESANEHVSVREVSERVAPHTEAGFFAIDLVELRKSLLANPWVEHVEVRRQFPDRLLLRVDERQPVASFGQQHLLSARGDLFEVAPSHWPKGLPALAGPPDERRRIYRFWSEASEQFTAVAMRVESARMSERGAMVLMLDSGCELLFPRAPAAQVLPRFLTSLKQMNADERLRLARVDLRHANGYSVVWKPAPTEPPTAPSAASIANPEVSA